MPKRRSTTTVTQKSITVMAQFAASAGQKVQLFRSIQGKIRNIGRVGRTNQKVPSAWLARRSEDCLAWCIQIIASSEVNGSAISRAESRSLTSWTLFTITMIRALRRIFPTSSGVKLRILSQGMRFMGKGACGCGEDRGRLAPCKPPVSFVPFWFYYPPAHPVVHPRHRPPRWVEISPPPRKPRSGRKSGKTNALARWPD